MSWMHAVFANLLRRRRVEREMDAELRDYLEHAVEEHVRRGLTPAAARRAARVEFEGIEQVKERVRDARAGAWLESTWRDVMHAGRLLGRERTFAAAAILTIALAIGVNTSIFSIVNALAFHRLPVPESDRVVSVTQTIHGSDRRNVHGMASFFSYSEYRAYRDRNRSLAGLAAYEPWVTASLGGPEPRQVIGTLASCNYFEVLGVRPARGRVFSRSDCEAGGSSVVVLGHELWQTAFGADPSILGRTVSLNRAPLVVIGIAPPGFRGTEVVAGAFWVPLTSQRLLQPSRDLLNQDRLSWLVMVGRLAPAISAGRAHADLSVIAAQIDRLEPGRATDVDVRVATILPQPEERLIVFGVGAILLAAVLLVLLVACANVANLLLARAAARRREMAVRLAIGAGRWRLVRQLLIESLLIAAVGGAAGTLVAVWVSAALVNAVLANVPAVVPALVVPIGPDVHVLAYATATTLATAVIFGLVPALGASRVDVISALKQREAASPDRHGARARLWRHALIGAQVAMSMVLLLSAGLLARGLARTYSLDPGFAAEKIAVVSFDLENAGYDNARTVEFNRRLLARISALPSVDRVALARTTPLSDQHVESVFYMSDAPHERVQVEFNFISPAYFDMFRLPIVRGRSFSDAELWRDARVMVVTEAAARRLWPGVNPIGKTLEAAEEDGSRVPYEVVGLTRDAQVSRLGERAPFYVYLPAGPGEQFRLQLLAHFRGSFASVAGGLRAAVRELDAELPVDVRQVEDNVHLLRIPARIAVLAAASLGGLALLLASIGLYGVVAYSVNRRVHEIGVRVALGAGRRDVIGLIVRGVARPVVVGMAVGLLGAAAAAKLLSGLLFGLSPLDPVAFIAVPAFLLAVALLAAVLPARRAARVDPMLPLRCE